MTKQEILNGNKVIALFSTDEPEVLKRDLEKAGCVESMRYHESWDWIMPVYFKISKIFRSDDLMSLAYSESPNVRWFTVFMPDNIEELWTNIVNFINWYTKYKQDEKSN